MIGGAGGSNSPPQTPRFGRPVLAPTLPGDFREASTMPGLHYPRAIRQPAFDIFEIMPS
jgi:hypothetical protein